MVVARPVILAVALFALATSGCATMGGRAGAPTADAIGRLEAQRRATPESAPVLRALGIAYYKAGRYPEARAALDQSAQRAPRDGTTALYLGLTAEQQGDLQAARAAYSSYLQYGRTKRVRGQLESRLAALSRKELTAAAKDAVLRERELAARPSNPRTVAVLPLRFVGTDTSLRALERGFAELLTTDLGRSRQVTVVERARLQAILDEIALQRSAVSDATTSVRVGRLTQAGRLVSGTIAQLAGNTLRVDANVIDVSTSQSLRPVTGDEQLDELFALEKRIVLQLFEVMGVQLAPAERIALDQRPTRSVAAFLSYSNGLLAEDQGRYEDASRFFRDAIRIDPGFSGAQSKSQESARAASGETVTAASVEASVEASAEGAVVTAATQGTAAATTATGSLSGTASAMAETVNP